MKQPEFLEGHGVSLSDLGLFEEGLGLIELHESNQHLINALSGSPVRARQQVIMANLAAWLVLDNAQDRNTHVLAQHAETITF